MLAHRRVTGHEELKAQVEQIRKERLMNTTDELDRIAEEAWEGAAKKQSELVNLTFTIVAAKHITYDYQGEQRQTYVATVAMDGKEEDYYLGGLMVDKQVKYLLDSNLLPTRVRLIRDADRKGMPYVLKGMAAESNGATPETAPKGSFATDADLITGAIEKAGIDEVVLALGDLSKVIMVDEDGAYVLVTKGLSLPDAATIRKTLRGLAG